ncbi:hypothetical protein QQ045_021741 [Rhodiola kirilowii]
MTFVRTSGARRFDLRRFHNLGLGYSLKMIDWKSCGHLLHLVEVVDVCIWVVSPLWYESTKPWRTSYDGFLDCCDCDSSLISWHYASYQFSDMAFQQISQQQQLQAIWVNQKQEIETIADFNNNSLPVPYARIEKIDDSGQRKS